MKKRHIVFISLIVFGLLIAVISITYALTTSISEETSTNYDLLYTFTIPDDTWTVTVPSGKTKEYEVSLNNPYDDLIKYGVIYKVNNYDSTPEGVNVTTIKGSTSSPEALIESNVNKNISVMIENTTSSSITVTLGIVNGYKNGGDLIIPSGYSLVDMYRPEANSPDLVQGLIPVTYNETTSSWVKADSTNSNNSWYDYNNKKWANAVLVSNTNRSTYQNASAGTTILESDILAFYVWIPRYKYKVWNKDKEVGIQSYNAKNEGIDIIFESEKAKTGTITCTYSYANPSSEAGSPNETCTGGSNGDYYTHPAFTFGNDEVRGFWIGKFEVSSSDPSVDKGGGNSESLTVRILPNVTSWRGNPISNQSKVIQNMQITSNIYGLSTSRTNTDSHMLTNMEWGAVAYLTNSRYGNCTNGTCTEVAKSNNCSGYITGIGDSVSYSDSTTCTTDENKYNGTKGVLASTTGNITGVYDMKGGTDEYVMGNMSSESGNYTFNSISGGQNHGFEIDWYSASTAKYVTTYAYGTSESDQTAYNRGRLGDATGEVVLEAGGAGGWNGYQSNFLASNYSWFVRGGRSSVRYNIFAFNHPTSSGNDSSRAALVGLF